MHFWYVMINMVNFLLVPVQANLKTVITLEAKQTNKHTHTHTNTNANGNANTHTHTSLWLRKSGCWKDSSNVVFLLASRRTEHYTTMHGRSRTRYSWVAIV